MKRGIDIVGKVEREAALADIAAAVARVASAGKVGVVGFCFGGTMAWLAAAQTDGVSAAVGYYGGGVIGLKDLKPRAPTILHFGEKDAHIPLAGVREVEAAHPETPVYVYPADHGFNCDQRGSYDAPSAKLAWGRTLDFLAKTALTQGQEPALTQALEPRRAAAGLHGHLTRRGPPACGVSPSCMTPRRRATSV